MSGLLENIDAASQQSNHLQQPAPQVVMLASHPPYMDPRVLWEADLIGEHFKVLVIGLLYDERILSSWSNTPSYQLLLTHFLPFSALKEPKEYLQLVQSIFFPKGIILTSAVCRILPCLARIAALNVQHVMRMPTVEPVCRLSHQQRQLAHLIRCKSQKIEKYQQKINAVRQAFDQAYPQEKVVISVPARLCKTGRQLQKSILIRYFYKPKRKRVQQEMAQYQARYNALVQQAENKKKALQEKLEQELAMSCKVASTFHLTPTEQLDRFNITLTHFIKASVGLWQGLKQLPSPPTVVHCHDLDTLLVGVMAKKAFGSKVVYDAHEFWAYSYDHCPAYQVEFFLWLEKHLLPWTDYAMTVNPLLAKEMESAYESVRPIYSLPNCEPWQAAALPPMRSEMSRLANGRVKFLFQGRFAPERGIEELIDAWQRMDASQAALFLRGPDNNYVPQFQAIAERLGVLNSSVYFLPPVPEEELILNAQEADVGIIPYRPIRVDYKNCCPNKLSQYMQAGLPILCNNLDFVKHILTEADCGLSYDSDRPETLVAAANFLLQNPETRQRFGRNAVQYSQNTYNFQAQSQPLLEQYQKFLQSSEPVCGLA